MAADVEDLAIRLSGDSSGAVNAYAAAERAGTGAARAAEKVGTATQKSARETAAAAKQTADAQQSVGQKMVAAGGILIAGFALAANASMQFQHQMSEVGAVSNASAAEMKQLSAAALEAGAATVFSANDAAQAEAELAKGGLHVADIIGGGLTGAMNLASAGQLDVARAAEITATALSQFSLKGNQASHVADLLAAGANEALGSVDDLAEGLKYVGPVAAGMGVSIEQTVGVLSEFAQAGIKGEQGGTSLRGVLSSLTSPSSQAADTMKQLGISVFDASGEFIGLDGTAEQLHGALSHLTEAQRSAALGQIFGNQQITAARILYEGGAASVQKWTDAVDQNGYAAELARKKMDNLSGDLENLRGSIDTALIKGGSGANGALRAMAKTATTAVNAFSALPGPVQAVATVTVGVVGAVIALSGAFLVARAQVTKLQLSLVELGISEERAAMMSRGLGVAMKGIGVAAVALALLEVSERLNTIGAKAPEVEKGTLALVNLAQQGHLTGDALKVFGNDFQNLGHQIDLSGRGYWTSFTTGQKTIKDARTSLDDLDKGLAGLVSAGHGDMAAQDFAKISAAAKAQGVSVGTLHKVFDDYDKALATQEAQQKLATGATNTGTAAENAHAAALKASAEAAKKAADAIKAQSDAMRAQFDPIFAVTDALGSQRAAQAALTAAIKAHGKGSAEAAGADAQVLRTTVDVDAAIRQLRSSLTMGATSQAAVNKQLDAYAAAGLISTAQAARYKEQLSATVTQSDRLYAKTTALAGLRPKLHLDTSEISAADAAAQRLHQHLLAVGSMVIRPTVTLPNGTTVSGRQGMGFQDLRIRGSAGSSSTAADNYNLSTADRKAAQARALQTPVEKAALDEVNATHELTQARKAATATAAAAKPAYDAYAAATQRAAAAATAQARAEAARDKTKSGTAARAAADAAVTSARKASDAADKAATKALNGYLDAKKNASDAIKALSDGIAALTQAHAAFADAVYAQEAEKAKAFTDDISSQLDALVAKADTMRSAFSSAVTAGSSLGDLFSAGAPDGGLNGINQVLYSLGQQVDAAKTFAGLQAELASAGLSDTLINQISAAGVSQGTMIARQILAGGPEAIASLNDLTSQLAAVASSGMDEVVAGFYGSGATALQQLAEGMRAGFPELDAVLAQIAGKVTAVLGGTATPAAGKTTAIPAQPVLTSRNAAPVYHLTIAPTGLMTGTPQQLADALAPAVRDGLARLERLGT